MVLNGFSLFDLKKLYIDELFSYYEEMFFNLEKMGKIKEGSYAKLKDSTDGSSKNTVNLLRKQLFRSMANAKKKK